jgi:hypothetical protein|tara:strand:+ start:753 stop:1166 length:414 start_codon:yes stop_codon:yes gene_type:complete
MAKLPYSWNKVSAGDIVSFVYESKDGKRLRRTILVLDPKRKNLLHGIQLEISNKSTNTEIKKILESAGTPEVVDSDKKIYRVSLDGTAKQTYTKMKTLIKRHGIYRTFNYDKAKKSSIFLEDLRLPTQFVRELMNEN